MEQVLHAHTGKSTVEKNGRGLFADRDFTAGDVIYSAPRPLAAVLDTSYLGDSCSNCFINKNDDHWHQQGQQQSKLGNEPKACAQCHILRFCSKKCQKQAWARFHKYECKGFAKYKGKLEEFPWSLRLATQLIAMRKHGIMTEEQWKGLCGMRSNEERFPPALAVGENHLLLRDALRYVGGYPEFPKQFPIGSLLRTNSFALTSPAFDNIGTAMDLVVANTNHSCEPNAYAIMNGPKIALRTLRPISKDEEIFINYVDVTEPFSMRRVELRGMYFFDCTCTKCKRGPKEKEDKFHRAPTALEKKLFNDLSVPRDGLEEARNSLGKGPELALLAIAQSAFRQSADIAITDVPSAVEKYHNLRTVQRTWANLDLWPQHRYPWPKIYNDILLATLDLESYYLALVFAAKIYLDVDPILYPQEHAPLRVVHTWRLLLLLVLFADKRKPTPRPADVHLNHGILITGLLYDLIVQVPKSHGTDTRFYKIVASKHEEITKPFGEATTRAYRSELDATVAAQMGDAVKGLRDLVDKVLEPEQRQPGDSYLRGCYEYLQAEAKVPFEERSEPILRSDE